MPKQSFQNGILSIDLDPADPQDQIELTIRGHKGQTLANLNPAQMLALLTALNQKYNLGLK